MTEQTIAPEAIIALVVISGTSLVIIILLGLISLLVGRLSKAIREHLSVAPDVTEREVAAEVERLRDVGQTGG